MNATCKQLVECLLKVVSMRLSMSPFFSVKRQPKWVRYKRKIPGVQSLESRRQECQLRPISRLEVSSLKSLSSPIFNTKNIQARKSVDVLFTLVSILAQAGRLFVETNIVFLSI